MFTSPEQFAAATRTLFELQMDTFNALASRAMQGVEQVVHLNMDTARHSVEETIEAGKQVSLARSPQAAALSAAACAQPGISAGMAYGKDMKALIENVHKDFVSATDAQLAEARAALSTLIHEATRQAQPDADQAVLMMKNAIDNAFRSYEQMARATQQAIRQVEAQVARATEQVSQPARDARRPH